MSSQLRTLLVFSAAAALASIVLGIFPPAEIVRIYVLALLAAAGVFFARSTLSRFGRVGRLTQRAKVEADDLQIPDFFERAQRRVELANSSGVYFEQLRPRLREIAAQRLGGHGVNLGSDEARMLLGEETWLALEHKPEGDKFAQPPEGRLAQVLTRLERL